MAKFCCSVKKHMLTWWASLLRAWRAVFSTWARCGRLRDVCWLQVTFQLTHLLARLFLCRSRWFSWQFHTEWESSLMIWSQTALITETTLRRAQWQNTCKRLLWFLVAVLFCWSVLFGPAWLGFTPKTLRYKSSANLFGCLLWSSCSASRLTLSYLEPCGQSVQSTIDSLTGLRKVDTGWLQHLQVSLLFSPMMYRYLLFGSAWQSQYRSLAQ